jgi:hypothetical protein
VFFEKISEKHRNFDQFCGEERQKENKSWSNKRMLAISESWNNEKIEWVIEWKRGLKTKNTIMFLDFFLELFTLFNRTITAFEMNKWILWVFQIKVFIHSFYCSFKISYFIYFLFILIKKLLLLLIQNHKYLIK